MKRRMRSWPALVALSAILAPGPGLALAQTAASSPPVTTRVSVKSTGLLSCAPDAAWLFPDRSAASHLWRARLESVWRPNDRWSVDAAYEQRVRLFSSTVSSTGAGVLPAEAAPPYRVTPLDWQLASGATGAWHHEIDRAAVRLQLAAAEITAGRQAVGWGRGVLFSAVDVFAPFSPLEADREWRRGIDALRADVKLGDRASVEVIGAFGARTDTSVYGARVRGYTDRFDVEVMGGRRARDRFAGVTTSLAVAGAELHAEAAVFDTPAAATSTSFAGRRAIAKMVLGGSYRLPIAAGVLVDAEYHYSGFGARSAEDTLSLLADPEFAARYVRGDTQMLGRHASAVVGSYEWSPLVSGGVSWLHNPVDGSGLVMPSLTLTPGDQWSVLMSAYVPYGHAPGNGTIRSEYGLTPTSLLVQLRWYR